jgi:NADPH2:quinone reductase
VKNRSAIGSSLRYFRWYQPQKLQQSVEELLALFEAGKLKPCITHTLPLECSAEAIRLLTNRQAYGKIVVTIG